MPDDYDDDAEAEALLVRAALDLAFDHSAELDDRVNALATLRAHLRDLESLLNLLRPIDPHPPGPSR